MNFLQRLSLAAKAFSNSDLFKGINDNPYYQTFNISGGFSFDQFNQEEVIKKGYAGNADLYSIVRKISSTAADIPLDLYEINREGEKELIREGELYDLIQQPNRFQTMPEFLEESLLFLLLSGNSYNVGYKSLGMGDVFREVNVLSSQYVTIETGGMADPIKAYWYQDINNLKFDTDEVMHTRYPNPKGDMTDRVYGLSPLEAGSNALQSSNNGQEARASVAKNMGANGIISSGSERSLTRENAEEMQKAWDAKVGNLSKFGRNLVTSASINYTQLGFDPQRLQLIESGVIDMRSLCNIYSVPSQLFNDVAGTTFNNMAAAKKSLYTEAVLPNLNLWLTNFNNWFISSWSKYENKEYCLEANTSQVEVLQEDKKIEAEKDKIKMEGINTVLNMPISNEAKSLILQQEYGYNEEEAQLITSNEITNEVD